MTPPAELRLVLTAQEYEAAVRLFQGGLGLRRLEGWDDPDGRGVVLDAGRATIEIIDTAQSERMDRIEAGEERSGAVRLAFRVQDTASAAEQFASAGAAPLAPPVRTPWRHHTQRLVTPQGVHVTLFEPEVILP